METVRQHEWEKPNDYPMGISVPKWIKVCPLCKTRRINAADGRYLYKVYGDHLQILSEEPPCIARHPEQEEESKPGEHELLERSQS